MSERHAWCIDPQCEVCNGADEPPRLVVAPADLAIVALCWLLDLLEPAPQESPRSLEAYVAASNPVGAPARPQGAPGNGDHEDEGPACEVCGGPASVSLAWGCCHAVWPSMWACARCAGRMTYGGEA